MTNQRSFNVRVAPDTMIRRDSGSIVGNIWIDIEDWSFPSKSWDDFPVVILGWWIEALISIPSRKRGSAKCNFMDGPYWFEISTPAGEVTAVNFFRRSKTGSNLIREETVTFTTIIEAILSAASITIDACNKQNWTSTDLDELVELYSDLKKRYSH